MRRILFTTTSYPRHADDWQSLFVRAMLDALAAAGGTDIAYWGPPGPLPAAVRPIGSEGDRRFLEGLAERGGIAHRLRSQPAAGIADGIRLVRRLRRVVREQAQAADVLHLNWLQSGLGLSGRGRRAVITVLGSDYRLLGMPGMQALLRRCLAGHRVILAPNAGWMVPALERAFAEPGCAIRALPFGIDERFYGVRHEPTDETRRWLVVLRLTRAKLGPLFEWSKSLAGPADEFHLFGPLQEEIPIPGWIHYHGPVTPAELAGDWYPRATAMVTLSRHDEGRPQVLLEAMAAGLPVIASRLPAHDDLFRDGRGGILVGDQAEFAAALETLRDPRRRERRAADAREAVRRAYGTWRDCAERYLAAYDELLGTTPT